MTSYNALAHLVAEPNLISRARDEFKQLSEDGEVENFDEAVKATLSMDLSSD